MSVHSPAFGQKPSEEIDVFRTDGYELMPTLGKDGCKRVSFRFHLADANETTPYLGLPFENVEQFIADLRAAVADGNKWEAR